ncbi:MAG TPA: TerC/Alx family metal homeostasis membrane protein [Pseudonocardiaceae bacterium]|jgi:tellurite resistance protein TerC|nr:TerC/Alx family metal homeostasis membrane protein [Pseudonocardiaceae bacterium]
MIVPLWVWCATVAGLAMPVGVDVWLARRAHPVGFREAVVWSAVYLGAAALFGLGVLVFGGSAPAMEFFTGFVVEKTLSIDNLFVFALILGAFAVPARHQSRVLLIGVLGALALRVVLIVVGAAALQRFSLLFLVFGALLVFLAVRLLRSPGVPPNVRAGRLVRWARRRLPLADDESATAGALITRQRGRRAVTWLGLAVLAILSVDVLFALDSVPAIFGITQNVYLVLCTNAFALLGLRALYFVLAGLLNRLVHLHHGLSAILGLIGVKLVLHYLHSRWHSIPEIPTWLSLTLILTTILITTVTSLRATRGERELVG